MGDIFKPFNQGDAFRPSAAQLNSWILAAKQAKVGGDMRGRPTTNFDPAGYLWCWVKNTTGELRQQYDAVSLRGVVVRAGVNGSDYKDRPYYKAIAPDPAICPAVFLEPCPNGAIRRAAIMGLVPCRINAATEGVARATIVAGQYHLEGGTAGYEIVDLDVGDEEDEEWEFEPGIKVGIVQIGGGGGSAIVIGQLIEEVPANSLLEDDCIELETFDGETFAFVMDDGETPAKVKTWAFNSSLNSAVRGSVGQPLRVWGVMYSVKREEGEETVTHQVLLILGHLDPLVGAHGFVLSPDNDKGQMLMHHDGVAATVAEGGACGGEE